MTVMERARACAIVRLKRSWRYDPVRPADVREIDGETPPPAQRLVPASSSPAHAQGGAYAHAPRRVDNILSVLHLALPLGWEREDAIVTTT